MICVFGNARSNQLMLGTFGVTPTTLFPPLGIWSRRQSQQRIYSRPARTPLLLLVHHRAQSSLPPPELPRAAARSTKGRILR